MLASPLAAVGCPATSMETIGIRAGILSERLVPLGKVQVPEFDVMFVTRLSEIIASTWNPRLPVHRSAASS